MIVTSNFPKAYVEVDEILKNLEKEEYEKIDKNFLKMVKNKKDKDYSFKIDYSKDIENQNILKETRAILAYVFLNYLGTKHENETIKQQFKKDIINAEEEKKKAYPVDIFKDRKVPKEDKKETEEQDQSLIVCKEENKLIKFIKRIFNFFVKK